MKMQTWEEVSAELQSNGVPLSAMGYCKIAYDMGKVGYEIEDIIYSKTFVCQPHHKIYCDYADGLKEQLESTAKMYIYEQNANEPLRNKITELRI